MKSAQSGSGFSSGGGLLQRCLPGLPFRPVLEGMPADFRVLAMQRGNVDAGSFAAVEPFEHAREVFVPGANLFDGLLHIVDLASADAGQDVGNFGAGTFVAGEVD